MRVCFTIFGEPASKANSRKIATFGRGETARTALIKSEKARNYERDALKQIPPSCRVRLEGPLRVKIRIFYVNERSDLDESVLLDVLQDRYSGKGQNRVLIQKGVYRNDRQVREKHIIHAIDALNPRAEVEIEPLNAQQEAVIPETEPIAFIDAIGRDGCKASVAVEKPNL